MSNLFQSFSNRADLPSETTQSDSGQCQCDSSIVAPLTDSLFHSEQPPDSCDEKKPVKRDLLSFLSRKHAEANSTERKASLVQDVNDCQSNSAQGASSAQYDSNQAPSLGQANPLGVSTSSDSQLDDYSVLHSIEDDSIAENVKRFLAEEYGNAYQTHLDVTAILKTALHSSAVENGGGATVSSSEETGMSTSQMTLSPVHTAPGNCSEQTSAAGLIADAVSSPMLEDSCLDVDAKSEAFCIASAVEEFMSTSQQFDADEYVPCSKKPRLDAKTSKIEFSVSQSTSTYHKWKSTVSVPDELVRKLPKPTFQPRLPPELAPVHSGPQVLRSSLNINFKGPATTKAELRFKSLATDQGEAPKDPPESLPDNTSTNEKPPVKIVIKTLSRESKPQRVVIISCSSSVRRDPSHRPNDDSDSDSCGRESSTQATGQTSCSVSLPVPQESSEQNSGSGQPRQGGKENTRSICFCSMQPTVKLTKIDGESGSQTTPPFQSSASSAWSTLQDMFHKLCEARPSRKSSQQPQQHLAPSKEADVAMTRVVKTEQARKDKSMRDASTELRRLSDSSGYCAFTNLPDKRESLKISALYKSTLLSLEKKLSGKESTRAKNSQKPSFRQTVKDIFPEPCLSKQGLRSGHKKRATLWRENRARKRAKFRLLRASRSARFTPPCPPDGDVSNCSLPETLDPLVAASFDRTTGEPTVDHFGRSSLHVAMGCNDNATLAFVIDIYKRSDDLDCKDNEGLTPLHLCCRIGNTKGAEMLLTAGASASSACPESGNTPLHEAALQENLQTVKLLVQFGADLTSKNNQGLTAMDLTTVSSVFEFLTATITAYSDTLSVKTRILYSDRKLPAIYVLRQPTSQFSVAHYVLKSELCSSLGVSPEYFDVHHEPSMKSHVLENSAIASRIVSPRLKATFEQSRLASGSSIILEVDEYFTSLFSVHNSSDPGTCSTAIRNPSKSCQAVHHDSSSDTEEMTDDDFSDLDECEIRRDDVKEINRSLKKLAAFGHKSRKAARQPVQQPSGFSDNTVSSVKSHRALKIRSPDHSSRSAPIQSAVDRCPSVLANLEQSQTSQGRAAFTLESSAESISSPNFGIRFGTSEPGSSTKDESSGLSICQEHQPIMNWTERRKESQSAAFPATVSGFHLQLYTDEFQEADSNSRALDDDKIVPKHRDFDCVIRDGDEAESSTYQIDLDLDEEPLPRTQLADLPVTRRKAHPLTSTRIKPTDSSGTDSVPLQVSSRVKKIGSGSVDVEKPNSIFKINILSRATHITQASKKEQSVLVPVKAFPSSKILCPSAMMRVLKPSILSCHNPSLTISPPKTNSSLASDTSDAPEMRSTPANPAQRPPVMARATRAEPADSGQLSSPVLCVEHGSKLFVRGHFKPIPVVMKPPEPAAPHMQPPTSLSSIGAPRPLGPSNWVAGDDAGPSAKVVSLPPLPKLTPGPNLPPPRS